MWTFEYKPIKQLSLTAKIVYFCRRLFINQQKIILSRLKIIWKIKIYIMISTILNISFAFNPFN